MSDTASVKTTEPKPQNLRQRRRFLFLALLLTLVGAGGVTFQRARQASLLRELYLPELETRASQEPNNGALLALTAGRLTEANDYTAAAGYLERAIRAGETDELVWRTWAAATAASGKREPAGAILLNGSKAASNPKPIRDAIERCRLIPPSSPVEKLAEAICPEGVPLLVSRYTQGSFLNGWVEKEGRAHPEISGFATRQNWAKEKPNDAQALRYWGEALTRNRRYVEAITMLRRTVDLDPTSLSIHLALADALKGHGEFGKAGLEYIAILKRKKDWLPALMGLGQVALEKRMLAIGTDVFERAVKQAPDNVDAWIGLGRAQYNRRLNLGRALEAFRKAEQVDPKRTDFYNNYSNALRANFKFPEAEAIIRRRLASDAGDAQAYYLLGLLLLDHTPSPERRTEALSALRTSMKLAPDVSATETRLSQMLVEDGKADEAIPILENTLKRDHNNLTGYQTLARALRKAGRKQDADVVQSSADELASYLQRTTFLEDLLQRQPGNIKSHRELADLYEQGNEPDKAQREQAMIAVLEKHPEMGVRGIKDMNEATALGTPEK